MLADLVTLWTGRPISAATAAAWPASAGGGLDIAGVAARFDLAATRLSPVSGQELRAIGLPALLLVPDRDRSGVSLLRGITGDTAMLVDGGGAELSQPLTTLTSRLGGGEAWVLWRNLDGLPTDPGQRMTSTVAVSLGLRLHKLGHLAMPLPDGPDPRLEQGVRAFQRSVGLPEDGIVGPRTTLALSRLVAGSLAPSLGTAAR
jgi:general secretion pathway protein A